jgi:hypothetical protein
VPGPGPLAPPQGPPPIMLRPAQRPQTHHTNQGYLQQPAPYSYTMPPGPPGPMP